MSLTHRLSRTTMMAVVCASLIVLVAGCASRPSRTYELETLNDSGVTGTVTVTDLGNSQTRVEISVDPAGHPNMPAHIHPGHCGHLTPQPAFPLQNVIDGASTTDVPEVFDELVAADMAVNLHRANDDLETFTACAAFD